MSGGIKELDEVVDARGRLQDSEVERLDDTIKVLNATNKVLGDTNQVLGDTNKVLGDAMKQIVFNNGVTNDSLKTIFMQFVVLEEKIAKINSKLGLP